MESLSSDMSPHTGVELVMWPRDEHLRRSLARAGVPRLLVLDEDASPPEHVAADEDWIRQPFDRADLDARLRGVAESVAAQLHEAAWLDRERVLHRGARTAVLTPSEAVVAGALLADPGSVVSRESLSARLWPDGAEPSRRAVDAIVYRLRIRCRALGLSIGTARGTGFVLLCTAVGTTGTVW